MKKTLGKISILLVLVALFVGLAPRFLAITNLQQEIVGRLNSATGSTVTCQDIRWSWLPFPHISLRQAHLSSPAADVDLPEVRLYPHWRNLFGDRSRIGRIYLRAPHFLLKQLAGRAGTLPAFPFASVIIADGSLTVAPWEGMPAGLRADALALSKINAAVQLVLGQVTVDLQAAAPFCEKISATGRFGADAAYGFDIKAGDFMLDRLVTQLAAGRLVPLASKETFSARLTGRNSETFSIQLQGTSPAFAAKQDNREIVLKAGGLDLTLENAPGRTALVIRNLTMREPGLRLQGTIERQQTAGHGPEDAPPPFWRIDLRGQDLDLAAIRGNLLVLWPENPVAKEVCAIVLGGAARQAAFQFAGPVADFQRLESMRIMATAEHVPLLVPGANLALTEAAGRINIVDGILSGQGLSARMQESQAENGQLFLSLRHDDKQFLLDMDLHADLAALPDVLRRLVVHQGFRDELNRFTGLQGSASGHLRLGDHLHDIATEITVNDMKASAEYDRLPWPLTIKGGRLRIRPGQAEWQEINAIAGPHTIHAAGGAVTWKEAVDLRIDQCRATLAGQNLFEELRARGLLPTRVSQALAEINGTMEIDTLSLHGPPTRPADWQYRLDLRSDKLHVASPLAGGPLLLEKASATIDQEKIMLAGSRVGFPDNPLQISGEFSHHLLENWSGRVRLNGTVMAALADRLTEKNWLPQSFFPRLPVMLQDIDITWDKASTSIAGGLVAGAGQQTGPRATLDIRATPEQLRINRVAFATAAEQGELSLVLDRNKPEEGFLFSWSGGIDADTVNAFLETNLLAGHLAGHLAGNWNGRPADNLKATTFAGTLQATDLQWFWRRDPEITYAISSLRCRGNGSGIEIDSLLLGLGEESAQISGQLAGTLKNLDMDLHLKAATLSWENVNRLLRNLRGDPTQKPSFTATGSLDFDVATFTSPSFSLAPRAPAAALSYQWRPFQGVVRLQPENHLAAQITGAQLCGLNFIGNWFSDASLEQSYALTTPTAGSGKFQDVLPCLGVKQDLVEGDFILQADGRRRNNIWKAGSVAINSTNGRILRMRLLSQIFSVINITDLFAQDAQPQAGDQGFSYSEMELTATAKENILLLDKAVIRGEGLNLFGSGEMDLASKEANFTVLIAPLKTLDAIVAKIPLIGRVVGGKHATVITIPVGVKGHITNPTVTPLSPEAIGDAVIELVKETLMLPFTILNPLLPADKPD